MICDIRPDCHHHFDTSGTSNAMFDELAERSLISPLAGTKHMYVRLAIIIYCQILALFFRFMNRNLKILSIRLYSPSLKNGGWIEDVPFRLIFHTFV